MKMLHEALVDGSYLLGLRANDIRSVFHQALNHMVAQGVVPEERRDELERLLWLREQQIPTAIGNAVAVPHAYTDDLVEPTVVFVRLARPLNLGAPDGIRTRFVFLLLGPLDRAAEHLDTLANIARLMSDDEFRYEARQARTGQELRDALEHFRQRTVPPKEHAALAPESLRYTGRLCGGILLDLRRRLPHYASDFRDGLHPKSISSTLFLYFACLAPAVVFGGIMAKLTDNHIGAVEMIVASAICGITYALLSGQPLIILGGTGPLLIFTALLYSLCSQLRLQEYFLETFAWVGVWTAAMLIVLAVTDASCLMRFFTRFTDEIFAALISLIFIYEAVRNLFENVTGVYKSGTESHDRALVPLLLAIGTFYVAMSLSRFRRSRYLLPQIREFLADFGPAIALAAMTAVAVFWFHDVTLNRLPAPAVFEPTMKRSWLVPLFRAPPWVWIASLGPALLVTTLVFLDQNITARLVNNPDFKLQKGEGYHWDLAIIGVLVGGCSLFGLPWLVAATVRSLNHLRSLATVEEVVSKEGDTRERVIHVRETRLSALSIHVLIGGSVLLLPLLREIPMSVLYGLFLFMGVVSMAGNSFFERLSLWLMDRNSYPSTHYIRNVPNWTIHKFTLIQLGCLAMLGIIKETSLGILFPLFIALLIPVRFLISRFFAPEHLAALDAETEPDEEENHWA